MEIRDHLITRTAGAGREGRPDEADGLRGSLAGAADDRALLDRRPGPVNPGIPALPSASSSATGSGDERYCSALLSAGTACPELVEGTFQQKATPSPST
ncbi:hypothetical protein [Streptomyces sp. NBC_01579]|uniref:hypothetical protein n=1 Tax=Streptomyces sp. NBC_01579 TaxID=2975885 RepID=UPI00386EE279